MKKERLIFDNGKLRNCDSNVAKIGYFKTVFNLCGYNSQIKELKGFGRKTLEAIGLLLSVLLFIVLFPVTPFIRGYFRYKRAVKNCRDNA